jgi:general secretion pathway protein J
MRKQAGYSLVELMIVLALLGLISLVIAGGLRFGSRVWERTERVVSATEVARGGHALLTALLGRIYPRAAAEGADVAFEGTPDRISFVADARGLARFTLSLKHERNGVSLILTERPEQGGVRERQDVLFTGAERVEFAYAEVRGGTAQWTDSWSAKPIMPNLIRVRATFPPGAGRWPDLIVRPRIDRAANCVYDPVSFQCRNG